MLQPESCSLGYTFCKKAACSSPTSSKYSLIMRYHLVSALVAVASLTPVVSAVLSMSKIADQCADTSGFNTCWNNALSTAQECYQQHCEGEGTCDSENDCTSSNGDCVQVCSCLAYAQMINCAITSCWNMVSCSSGVGYTRIVRSVANLRTGFRLRVSKPRHIRR